MDLTLLSLSIKVFEFEFSLSLSLFKTFSIETKVGQNIVSNASHTARNSPL